MEQVRICKNPECDYLGMPQPISRFNQGNGQYRKECNSCHKRRYGMRGERKVKPWLKNPETASIRVDTDQEAVELWRMAEQKKQLVVARKELRKATKAAVTPVGEVSANMMAAFGGPESFAKEYVAAVRSCDQPHQIVKGMADAMKLFNWASQTESSKRDTSMLSDEELETELNELIDRRLAAGAVDVEYQKVPDGSDHST